MTWGGTKVLPEKWLESCLTNQSFFLSKLRWPPQKKKVFTQIEPLFLSRLRWPPKKKKKSSLTLRRFFYPVFGIFYEANLPKRHEIAQNFDAILPKKYEIAWNFDAKSPKIYKIAQNFARNLDTLRQPGGQCPQASPTSYAYGYRYGTLVRYAFFVMVRVRYVGTQRLYAHCTGFLYAEAKDSWSQS